MELQWGRLWPCPPSAPTTVEMVAVTFSITHGWVGAGGVGRRGSPHAPPLQLWQSGPTVIGTWPCQNAGTGCGPGWFCWPRPPFCMQKPAVSMHGRLTGANSRSSHSAVCNFMSHEKCLKHVKTPCAGVAPSLVRVRMECGQRAGEAGSCGRFWAESQAGCLEGVVWAPRMLTASLLVSPSQSSSPASLPTGPNASSSGVPGTQHRASRLLVGLVRVCFIQLALDVSWGRGKAWRKQPVPRLPGQYSQIRQNQQGYSLQKGWPGLGPARTLRRVGSSSRGYRGAGEDLGGLQGSGRWCG